MTMPRDEYYERKGGGLCVFSRACNEPCDGESVWCAPHHARVEYLRQRRLQARWRVLAARASRKRWRRKRARLGLCLQCSLPADRKYTCEFHSAKIDQLNQRRREKRPEMIRDTMRLLVALLFVFVTAVGTLACAHIPTPIADFGECVEREMSTQVQGVITEVETDLAAANYVAALTDLAKRVGWAVVDCAVHEITGKARAQLAAAPNARIAAIKIEHGDAWLARK